VSYIDAGYVVALSGLALYALGLLARRRRLERVVCPPVARAGESEPTPSPAPSS
jgi:hypothetical protein